ncbi:MAG: hypothetical protein RR568_02740 [Anaerorhabdus sp.]|uniref:hypothetical protein n=1 Tax=Anaerorhabdus sp. TaxID=1872524 RepID=UPI002FC8AC58
MKCCIDGKNILFFSPAFFNYEQIIKDKMEELGAFVDMYDERSVTKAIDRALVKISPKIFSNRSQRYYENIIKQNKGKLYDYILIVKCDMTPIVILEKLKEEYPNAKMCLYLWDSIDNISGVTDKFKFFDILHSFDKNDCKIYPELKFRPLFYADEFRHILRDKPYKYDICFAGTIHSDRYAVIKQVKQIAKTNNMSIYLFCYLQSKFIYYFYKVTKKEFRRTRISDFDLEMKSSDELVNIIDDSRITLDVQHPKQTGLTMRTIEMIGMNKKMITTNEAIKDYDFYNPNNISVVDRNNVYIEPNFLHTQYEQLDDSIYKKYSLQCWIFDVLS